MKALELSGHRFFRLTVVRRSTRSAHGKVWWDCKCDCGGRITVSSSQLTTMHVKSCGCWGRVVAYETAVNRTHGHAKSRSHGRRNSPTYASWASMLKRCRNPNDPAFFRYGGRGITFHPGWRDFTVFLADMGERPDGTSLDRIDPNGNYEPGNCRWATRQEQSENQRLSAPRVARILNEMIAASPDLLERGVLESVRKRLLG